MKKYRSSYRNRITIILLLLLLLILSAFLLFLMIKKDNFLSQNSEQNATDIEANSETSKDEDASSDQKIDAMISEMSLEEKVCQLFFITPESLTGTDVVTQAGDTTKACLEQYPVGGLIYFSQNIDTEKQLTSMISNSQSYSKIPLFIGIDEEGGSLVARIANHPNFDVTTFPDMAEIGASGDPAKAYEVGSTIGSYLSDYGFNLDFAPVADVLINPENTAIGSRSFGSDPSVVSEMVKEEVLGLQDQQVSAVLKHFPGHGATTEDSHNGAAIVNRSLDELRNAEFLPFEAGIQAGADFVMVGHLQVPQVIPDDTPASLSSVMITDILRNELGFDGIVITDSLSMGAVTDYYTPAEAAVMCIQAGGDIILMPQDFKQAYQGVLDAVNNQTISEDRINESVKRILRVKYQ